jgi:hypothetical protein
LTLQSLFRMKMEEMKMRAHQKVCSTSSPFSLYVAPPVLSLYNSLPLPLSVSFRVCVCARAYRQVLLLECV